MSSTLFKRQIDVLLCSHASIVIAVNFQLVYLLYDAFFSDICKLFRISIASVDLTRDDIDTRSSANSLTTNGY